MNVDTAVTALADQLSAARADLTPLRIVGSGTWLDAGRPVVQSRRIDTLATAGIVEYVPGDLVITVGAGTTLREIAEVTRENDQWLALDPAGSDLGTIGATVATASSGSLALAAGRVRDLVLGLTVLTGEAKTMIAGGRVVKNVAGFDLVRLQTGAFGTLGVITEVSIRLHALPEVDETVSIAFTARGDAAQGGDAHSVPDISSLSAQLDHSALGFQAMELINGAAARQLEILPYDANARSVSVSPSARDSSGDQNNASDENNWFLLTRMAGNRDRVNAQRALLRKLGPLHECDSDVWAKLRLLDSDCTTVVRVGDAPSRIQSTISRVQRALANSNANSARVCATPHNGTVRVMLPSSDYGSESIRQLILGQAGRGDGSLVCERLPDSLWQYVAPVNQNLISHRIRDAFDPDRLLNRETSEHLQNS